jgi:hypothetical protein
VLGFTPVADEPEQDRPGAISSRSVSAGDSEIATTKSWVVTPRGAGRGAASILLARAATPEQERFVSDQAGGRVFLSSPRA